MTATERRLTWRWFLVAAVVYIVMIQGLGLILGQDLHYETGTIPDVETMARTMTIPIACSMVFAAGLATWLGWWPEIWRDHEPVQRWVRIIPIVFVGAAILACDYGNLLDQKVGLVLLLALTTAMVGFTEELMFRGIGVSVFRRGGFTEGRVALWTSLSFGALHLSNAISTGGQAIAQALVVSFAGYFFYLIRRQSGGIALAMVVHAIWDFALISGSLGTSKSVYAAASIAPLALLGVGIVVFRRRHRIEPDAGTRARGDIRRVAGLKDRGRRART